MVAHVWPLSLVPPLTWEETWNHHTAAPPLLGLTAVCISFSWHPRIYLYCFFICQLIYHQNLKIIVPTPYNTLVILWGRDKNFQSSIKYDLINHKKNNWKTFLLWDTLYNTYTQEMLNPYFFGISQLRHHWNLKILVPTPHNYSGIMWGRDKTFKVSMMYQLRNL